MAKSIITKKRGKRNCNRYVPTTCQDCKQIKLRRSDALKKWGGTCRSCARRRWVAANPDLSKQSAIRRRATIASWSPQRKAELSEKARQQVLRQGGVPNARKFTSAMVRGSANGNWKGPLAKSPPRQRAMKTLEYVAWRTSVFVRDEYTCQMCKKRGGQLQADHILPYSTHPDLRYEISNGRTLCKPCHQTTDTYGAKALRFRQSHP